MVRGDEPVRLGDRAGHARWSWRCSRSPTRGRVRVTVRDAATKDFVPKVQVKVIGSDNPTFLSGETDLRGVFVAEGVRGQVDGRRPQGHAPVRLLPRHDRARRPPPSAPAAPNDPPPRSRGQALADARREPQEPEHRQPDPQHRPPGKALPDAGPRARRRSRRRVPLSGKGIMESTPARMERALATTRRRSSGPLTHLWAETERLFWFPPPLWGRAREGGSIACGLDVLPPPSPNPPPQGGRGAYLLPS